jgi:hypothetical protein
MKYLEWEGAVIEAVAESMAISHSGAVGVVEAQPSYMQQSWGKRMDAFLTAAKVNEAAQEQAEERAMASAPKQERMLFGDEADAYAFWKDKEFKTFAVDLVQGNGKKQKVIRTMYVRSRTAKGGVSASRKRGYTKPSPCLRSKQEIAQVCPSPAIELGSGSRGHRIGVFPIR